MLFMIIEHFEGGDPAPVYRRFAERGRMAPPGLEYHGSWVTDDLTRCYQVMECADRSLLEEWMKAWDDLVRFEVIEVMSSADAVAAVAARERARTPPIRLAGYSQLALRNGCFNRSRCSSSATCGASSCGARAARS